ncbi:MAG: ABC transporter permease [Endomicrobiales bacterium]|nr:ABC transporter permease [Endomicrobiales bacterium]
MKILSIAYYTLIENIRNKIFYVLVFFGLVIIAASLLLAAIGGEQPIRILLDLGLNAIEFFALLTICYAAVNLVLEEIETKTIYLILTRPISKSTYLIGRFVGLLIAVYSGMLLMAFFHVIILHFKGWEFTFRYVLSLLLSFEKITIIGSVALFFSIFSTSAISSLSFTISFWILGHFSEELKFLGEKATLLVTQITAKAAYYIVPNLQFFNLRDFWDIPQISGGWIFASVVYGFIYSAFCLFFALWFLKYKEF